MILSPYQKPPIGSKLNLGHPLAKGLVGCWLMNEGSGNRVQDYSGNGNHGICTNMSPQSATSGWMPGPHGPALAFDGSNDYADISGIKTGGFGATLIFMIRIPTTSISAQYLLDSYTPRLIFGFSGDNNFQIYDSAWRSLDLIIPARTNIVITITLDGTKATGYQNAIYSGQVAFALTNFGNTTILGSRYTKDQGYWIGILSYLFIYNRVLTANEVAQHYAFPYCMFDELTLPAWMYPSGGILIHPGMNGGLNRPALRGGLNG